MASCKKSEVGGGKLSYRIKTLNHTATISRGLNNQNLISEGNTITWTSGSLNISKIDFEAKKENAEIEYELKQLTTVDLLNLSPVLGSISIPDGDYKEVELKLELKKTTTGAVPLMLKGQYTDSNGVNTPIEFSFNENVEIKVEAKNVVISSTNYIAMINLQMNRFTTNVAVSDLSQATRTEGRIVISSTSNANLYNKVKSNFNFVADCDFEK
jgi:hypothetical protein